MNAVRPAGVGGSQQTTVLKPTDVRLQLLLQPQTGATSVALHATTLPLQVSLPAVAAVQALVGALEQGGSSIEEESQAPAAEQAQQDDLRSLLFTYVASDSEGRRPEPLQVQVSSTATGGGGLSSLWGGGGGQQQVEHCISWSYSLPRPVMAVLIEVGGAVIWQGSSPPRARGGGHVA